MVMKLETERKENHEYIKYDSAFMIYVWEKRRKRINRENKYEQQKKTQTTPCLCAVRGEKERRLALRSLDAARTIGPRTKLVGCRT